MGGTISGSLLEQTRWAYGACIAQGKSGKVFTTKDNNYSIYAMSVYILSVAVAEAFMNEVVSISHHWKRDDKSKLIMEEIIEMDPLQKYSEIPVKLWGKELVKSCPPYQDFYHLVKIRNEITHYRMEPSKFAKEYVRHLRDRKVLIETSGVTFGLGHLDPVLSTKAAKWAYNTACSVSKQFIELAQEDTTPFIKESLKDMRSNFQEIP